MCGCPAHYSNGVACQCQCPSHHELRMQAMITKIANNAVRRAQQMQGNFSVAGVYIPPTQPVILVDHAGQEMGRASVHKGKTSLKFRVTRAGLASSIYSVNDDFLFTVEAAALAPGDAFDVQIYVRSA